MSNSTLEYQNKWVVLSGASSGIGQAIAMYLSQHGAKLVLLGRNLRSLQATADALVTESRSVQLDLADIDAIQPTLLETFQDLNSNAYGLCHCAGVVETRPLSASKPSIIQNHLQINLLAGLELARTVVRRDIMRSDGGSILFIASIYARIGAPGQVAYCASKGAIPAAVRAMAVELAPRNIRVNALSPGFVKTQMTEKHARLSEAQLQAIIAKHPLGAGQTEDIARAAHFLLSPNNKWITGTDLVVDGGYTAL